MGHKKKPDIKPLEQLCLRDDFMFGAVFRNENICKRFLEKLLHIRLEKIVINEQQKTIQDSYDFHSIRLDAYVKDGNGTVYNIEMQTTDKGALPLRARRYLSSIDRETLLKSTAYDEASSIYVIFICDYDELGLGYAMYERETKYRGIDQEYCDKTHVCFLNSRYLNDLKHKNVDPEILQFLDYVRTADDSNDFGSQFIADIIDEVNSVRNDRAWRVKYMTVAMKMQEYADEAVAEAAKEYAIGMYKQGMSAEVIATVLSKSVPEVQKILNDFTEHVVGKSVP